MPIVITNVICFCTDDVIILKEISITDFYSYFFACMLFLYMHVFYVLVVPTKDRHT